MYQSSALILPRFLPYLRRAVQFLVRRYEPTWLYMSTSVNASETIPSSSLTTREFNVAFYNLPITSGIRDLRMDKIGQLMSISGTVTRTSEVRPELVNGTFVCDNCKTAIHDVEQQFKYTEVCFFLAFTCWQLTRSSLSCVKTRFAVTATSGNLTLNNPNFPTGKRSVFKKMPTKFQPVVCHDHLTLFSVQKSSSEPKPVTNAPLLVPSSLFPMFHSLVFLV